MGESKDTHPASTGRRPEEFWALARRIAHLGTLGSARLAFLEELSRELLGFSGSVGIHLWMTDVDQDYHWHMAAGSDPAIQFEPLPRRAGHGKQPTASQTLDTRIRTLVTRLQVDDQAAASTSKSIHIQEDASRQRLQSAIDAEPVFSRLLDPNPGASMLLLPLPGSAAFTGLIVLCADRGTHFPEEDRFLYQQVAETIGRAVINRRAQFRLQERIKELTCLHGVAQAVQSQGDSPESAYQAIIALLPPAMQFPAIADARLTIDDRHYSTCALPAGVHCLDVPVVVDGRRRGSLAVSYREDHPEFAAGAFLPEERDLLCSVAHEIAMLVERSESDAAKASMAEQLRHADRLATIGQLAAGVAHELNEPLGNIMGFAQLLQKQPALPDAAHRDAEQIVQAALHGREIVKKLLLFARQSDSRRLQINLNNLIRDSLYFLEARCRKGEIDLRLELADEPLNILAVPSEMTQVLVNLAVNAIQAMPTGGTLTIRTQQNGNSILLSVEDTGHGMDAATQQRLFTPFFTTKDIGEGTGLGLSVVLGIVSAHGGVIHVESAPGRGARFDVQLPAIDETIPSEASAP